MRILRCIRSVNPEGGGPIEGIVQVSRVLQEMGHAVEVVSLDRLDDPWALQCPLRVHAVGNGGRGYGFSPRYAGWMREHARRFDAVIVSGLWQYQSFGTWRALGTGGPGYFVFPHGMLDPWFKRAHPLKHLKKWLYWPWAEYRVLRDARAVLFTCEEERRRAAESFRLYRCQERVVNYGTAAPPPEAEDQRKLFLKRHPELKGKRLVLFLGRIHPKKGCDLLIDAFAVFLREIGFAKPSPPWHLVVAGPDQTGWKRELENRALKLGIDRNVAFTGMLQHAEKWGAYRSSEVFVLPSHQENFGIAVAEALACGLPVVVSKSVNIWREIVHDSAGWACGMEAKEFAARLSHVSRLGAEDRATLCASARRCFEQRFEITRVARSLLEIVTNDWEAFRA